VRLGTWRVGVALTSAGDLDGDGCDDLALATGQDLQVAVHRGSSDGPTLDPVWLLDDGPPEDFTLASVGDVLGLGRPQLAVAASDARSNPEYNEPAWLRLVADDGGGPLVVSERTLPPRSGPPRLLPVGDVDGDGHDDLVLALPRAEAWLGRVDLLLGGPDGLAADPAWTLRGEADGERFGDGLALIRGGDGAPEALVVMSVDRVVVYRWGPDGLGAPRAVAEADGDRQRLRSVTVADLDADGRPELLVGEDLYPVAAPPTGRLRAWTWTGSKLKRAERLDRVAGWGATVAAVDLDGDGRPELAVGSPVASPHRPSEGTLALHRGEELPLLARGGGSGALLGAALATGDFDCDGRPELLVSAPYHPGPNDPMGQTPGEIYAVEP